MKRLNSYQKYRKLSDRRLARYKRNVERRKDRKQFVGYSYAKPKAYVPSKRPHGILDKLPISAPSDLHLFNKIGQTLEFVRDLRMLAQECEGIQGRYVAIDLTALKRINYATISILKALYFDFTSRNIHLLGNMPADADCKEYLLQSGYLDGLSDMRGRKFPPSEASAYIYFEGGGGRLTQEENRRISDLLELAIVHLNGRDGDEQRLKTLILEACANSIEWSGTVGKQWLMGMKKEEGEVYFTVTDVGQGILGSLRKKFSDAFLDLIKFRTEDEVLMRAFERKYGSSTKELNRNKGLPSIRMAAELGVIEGLTVVTNNVILRFDPTVQSVVFPRGFPRYGGTLYQWKVSSACLNKMREREYADS